VPFLAHPVQKQHINLQRVFHIMFCTMRNILAPVIQLHRYVCLNIDKTDKDLKNNPHNLETM